MLIKEIGGKNFRNLCDFSINPHSKMNVICGENAQGKTNLLESIWLFTGAKSFRTNKDNELVNKEKTKSRLNINFIAEEIEKEAEIEIENRRKATLNGKKLSSASKLAGTFCSIVFSPDDLNIVSGSPEKRRKFLDIAISQIYPKYLEILKRYVRALSQRNYLLKEIKAGKSSSDMLLPFEEELAFSGSSIIKYRIRYLEILEEIITDIYKGISSNKEDIKILYLPVCSAEKLKEKLFISRSEDILSGSTSVGPHRDDLDFKINEMSVKNYGSQGQKRSVALSLKLSEAEILKKITGEYPVALLDDVMSELDPSRQNYVLNHISKLQVFITCCDPANIINLNKGNIYEIKKGQVFLKEEK